MVRTMVCNPKSRKSKDVSSPIYRLKYEADRCAAVITGEKVKLCILYNAKIQVEDPLEKTDTKLTMAAKDTRYQTD
ncbi:Hypothetical predicted protein [Octopus vulgaris]|uniref:Uncharacterized protein n=1 Tax=Octopus vulgaris TaxID=6645 RepID=A0AA36BJK6_OCTVU|nr:Hypothetical predicted protein [Octopus vulgaris]